MKRTLILAALTAAAAFTSAAPASANAASCSTAPIGGEPAPAFNAAGTGIKGSGPGGYTCTVQWNAVVMPKYENGGVWHDVSDIFGFSHPSPGVFFGANTTHTWSEGTYIPDGSQADTPACAFNWRYEVQFINSNNVDFQEVVSPTLHKLGTC